jgi:DNA-binding LytR/AlgR family response regulator
MIRAIAIDDEPPALRIITRFCEQVNFIELQQTFSRTNLALQYLTDNPVDLLFLDVNMPSMSGIDFYRTIDENSAGRQPMVIFTTAYAEYAVEGFNLSAIDYLLKPFTFERFLQAANRASDYHQFLTATSPAKSSFIYIRADYQLYKISLADIQYIEGLDDYLKIHLPNQRPIVTRMTMKTMLLKLDEVASPEDGFLRVHRSFIVPLNRIDSIKNKALRVAGQDIPIGASYEAEVQKRLLP